jgi:NB-ARC domain
LVLSGLGGMGKTQLAIAYAQRHCGSYESIFWLNAMSEVALKTSLRLIAERLMEPDEYEKLGDEQILLRIRRWLSETTNTQWLLIFDNYDDPDLYSIQKHFLHTTHGSIIIMIGLPDQVSGKQIQV